VDERDRALLARAVALATENVAAGGGPFGALVARGGVVLATGTNRVVLDLDPTAHAEVTAIRAACRAVASYALASGTLYASCEPCPLCLAAAWWARLERIVFAATRDDAAAAGFDDRRFYAALAGENAAGLPRPERLLVPGGERPFRAWAQQGDRTPY
jgi:guanine deaminase